MLNFNELSYFLTVAQTQSFVRAGELLGVSSSALSHSMKNLEKRLNLRLLNRTTRNISLTEAGEQLANKLAPLYRSIHQEVDALSDFLDTPSGHLRINSSSAVAETVLYPKLKDFLKAYPNIHIEVMIENRWVDIVKEQFDMGIRLGDDVAHDMIAVRISDPLKMVLVASADYLKDKPAPASIEELDRHQLIGMRISNQHGQPLEWEFMKNGQVIKYQPKPHFSINNHLLRQAVLDGLGIAWLVRDIVREDLAKGDLIEVLPDYAMEYEPFYLYYPNRQGHSNAFKLLVEALRV